MNLEIAFMNAMAYIRLSVLVGLVSFIALACFEPMKNCKPFIRAVGLYFLVSLGNQLISNFYSRQLAQDIIAIVGTPLLFILVIGIWLSLRRDH